MISNLDNLLRELFMSRMAALTQTTQVSFQPPDENWRAEVVNLRDLALNVYLVDMRENRKLFSNERDRVYSNGMVITDTPAPRRIDCHYLISAWSPAAANLEPTRDEHALLYDAVHVLMNADPLNTSRIYPSGSLPIGFPQIIQDVDLPTTILPGEGFLKLAEFWGTMGTSHRWKPTLYLIVTLPVKIDALDAGPMVTTRITTYNSDTLIQIGGQVLNVLAPMNGAWVQLLSDGGAIMQTTTTNEEGRYTFSGLESGNYRLRVRTLGFPELPPRPITVPSTTGNYDLQVI